jgi:hypothetical protein
MMSNRSVPFFRDYLRVLGACVSYVEAARRLNISEDWVYKNLSASKSASKTPDVTSVFLFESEEGDGEPRWFHQHVKSAITNSIQAIEAAARNRALHGVYTVAKFQGRTVYQIDPDLEELGFEGVEAYRRDENGKPLPELVWTAPSTDLVLGILAANSKTYKKNSTIDVNMRGGGVVMMPLREPAKIAAPLPMVEIIRDAIAEPERVAVDEQPPADFNEIDMRVTDTPAEPLDDEADASLTPAPASGPVIRAETPPEYVSGPNPLIAPRNGRPLSDLERDLLSKLPSVTNRRA